MESNYAELENFYNSLKREFKKNLINNSLFITLFETSKNNLYMYLDISKRSENLLEKENLNYLREKGFITNFGDMNNYVISINGIWEYEKINNIVNEKFIIDYLNEHKFNLKKEQDIEIQDKEKVLLMGLIASRAFSETSCVDLNKENYVADKWKEVFEKSFYFLKTYDLLKKEYNKIFSGTKNVHIVSELFRRAQPLKINTNNIYSFKRNREYWLNLYEDDYFKKNDIAYLFYILFKGNLDASQINEVSHFCNKISNDYFIDLFDINKHIFYLPEYDDIIKRAIIRSIEEKRRYEQL